MLLMRAPTTENPEQTTTETKPLERKQKLVTLGRRVNNLAWSEQVFHAMGKSMPGKGRGLKLADIQQRWGRATKSTFPGGPRSLVYRTPALQFA